MFKNIGRSVRVLSLVLAGLCFIGFAVFGTLCLFAALGDGVDDTLKTAGIQAAIICYVLAVLTPFLQLITYGLGALIDAAQESAQDNKKIKEILQSTLVDGQLSAEIARKSAMALDNSLARLQTLIPQNENAPVQRPVVTPVIITDTEETVEETCDAEDEVNVEKIEDAQSEVAPIKPIVNASALRPLTDNSETF